MRWGSRLPLVILPLAWLQTWARKRSAVPSTRSRTHGGPHGGAESVFSTALRYGKGRPRHAREPRCPFFRGNWGCR